MAINERPADDLIIKKAEELKKYPEIKPPEWARFVKTGVSKERPPTQKDWWWIRSASILRKLSSGQNLGVSRMRKVYGSRKNRGHQPEKKLSASGSVIREILQQLEASGLVKTEKGKGRRITAKGKAFLRG
jgi:small subunit ribosomal protein S19e